MTKPLANTASSVTRYCVLFRQESDFKVEIDATCSDDAIETVTAALEEGSDLDATPYGGSFDVISATAIAPGGAQ